MPPPVKTRNPFVAQGQRLVGVDELTAEGVVEVETDAHGTLAVGMAKGEPFAVSNVCRHQFAKLGQGSVDQSGCLVCPWHRARYDVASGDMLEGPKGKVWGTKPYSKMIEGIGHAWKLKTFDVEARDGAIWLR